MRQSTCFTMTLVFTIAAIASLLCAIICDATNNSSRSVIFGCVACACSIPAFSSALILFQSGIDDMKTANKIESEKDTSENIETIDSEEENDAE